MTKKTKTKTKQNKFTLDLECHLRLCDVLYYIIYVIII